MAAILLFLLLLFQLPFQPNDDAGLLESGKAVTVKTPTGAANEIKIVSYNIRWRSGDDLRKMTKLLRDDPEIGSAAILGLQEVDRKKKRSRHSNVARIMAEELGMHYAWAAPPAPESDDEEETGVALLSVYPLSDVKRFVLPHKGPNGRRRAAIGATVEIGDQKWRVYSIHAETRLNLDKKMEQYKALIDDLAGYPANTPAVVMGDFNTWEASADRKTIKLFSEAGFRTPFGGQSTFRRRLVVVPIQFRLDWVWLRGLDAASYGIDREVDISDHWPLWANVKVSPAGVKSTSTKQ